MAGLHGLWRVTGFGLSGRDMGMVTFRPPSSLRWTVLQTVLTCSCSTAWNRLGSFRQLLCRRLTILSNQYHLSRFTPRVGGGSALYFRLHDIKSYSTVFCRVRLCADRRLSFGLRYSPYRQTAPLGKMRTWSGDVSILGCSDWKFDSNYGGCLCSSWFS